MTSTTLPLVLKIPMVLGDMTLQQNVAPERLLSLEHDIRQLSPRVGVLPETFEASRAATLKLLHSAQPAQPAVKIASGLSEFINNNTTWFTIGTRDKIARNLVKRFPEYAHWLGEGLSHYFDLKLDDLVHTPEALIARFSPISKEYVETARKRPPSNSFTPGGFLGFCLADLLNNKSSVISTAAGMAKMKEESENDAGVKVISEVEGVDFSKLSSLLIEIDPVDEQDLKDTLPVLSDILRFIGSAIISGSPENMEVVNGFWNVFGGVYAVRVMDFAQTVSVLEKRLLTST